jgi:hypothetical protein
MFRWVGIVLPIGDEKGGMYLDRIYQYITRRERVMCEIMNYDVCYVELTTTSHHEVASILPAKFSSKLILRRRTLSKAARLLAWEPCSVDLLSWKLACIEYQLS